MEVTVIRNGVPMVCTSEEQLKTFLDAGYVEQKKPEAPIKKTTTKK